MLAGVVEEGIDVRLDGVGGQCLQTAVLERPGGDGVGLPCPAGADAFLGAAPLSGETGGAAAMAALDVRAEDQDGIFGGAAVVGERGEHIAVAGLWRAPAAESFAGQFAARLALQERLGTDPGVVALDDGTTRFGVALLGAGDRPGVAPWAGPADVDLDATAIDVAVENEISVSARVRW